MKFAFICRLGLHMLGLSRYAGVLLLWALCSSVLPAETTVSFSRDIRPLLSDKCFACHGPDENTREADLRMDKRESVLAAGILQADSEGASELVRRITSSDEDEVMPPPHTRKSLSQTEIALIRAWVRQGANYEVHWAYRPNGRPQVGEAAKDLAGVENPIDTFLNQRLSAHSLTMSNVADDRTLVRRIYLDLLGVPPSMEEAAKFLEHQSSQSWSALVNRLLDDKRYGERIATYWLDLVRYADTIGYHSDTHMEISAYRDYVINAFNRNLSFDQFTMEQLAGDLLDSPTEEQLIASGYNRLLQTTEEGGAQAKEYIAIYAADRVRNVSGVWLGSTLGCAQCHDHKYDPFTSRDFYSMAAFFADINERAIGKRVPNLTIFTDSERAEVASLEQRIAELQDARLLESNATLAVAVQQGQQAWESKALEAGKKLPDDVKKALGVQAEKRDQKQQKRLSDYYRSVSPELASFRKTREQSQKRLKELQTSARKTLVTKRLDKPRMTRILPRGNWLDDSGEVVAPAVPRFLPQATLADSANGRATRLDLARWIVADENPLTARVFVNRLWSLFFGRGLAANLEDVGGQGNPPTHPELLDWLAVEFRESGWDVKHMVRLMVSSKAYRQSSLVTEKTRAIDPDNQWYARQGRWRLNAEFVRDSALQISGLLNTGTIGGKSVKPFQPAGYWRHLNFPVRKWQPDSDPDRYRRSMYTYWCRTFLHPAMLAFDAPSREECTAKRAKSNIPQQALVMLNEPGFVEASRHFAQRVLAVEGDVPARLEWAFQAALTRSPGQQESELLVGLLESQRKRYGKSTADAQAFLKVGKSIELPDEQAVELAAWTQVTRAILNMYETTSRF